MVQPVGSAASSDVGGQAAFEVEFGRVHDANLLASVCFRALECETGFWRNDTSVRRGVATPARPSCEPCGTSPPVHCRLDERVVPCRKHSPPRCERLDGGDRAVVV